MQEMQNAPVEMTQEQLENLKQIAQQLDANGEVLVQTAEDAGENETPVTVQ